MQDVIKVGVVIMRCRAMGPWASESWLPVAALPDAPELDAWPGGEGADPDLRYAGAGAIELFPSQTGHYRDNLQSGRPSLWISLRAAGEGHDIAAVTADPYEGEAMVEGNGEVVEAVAMPAAIRAMLAEYVARHHVERPFIKRKRDR